MAEATLRSGDPRHIDYTPTTGDVAAGQVVVFANTGFACGISPVPIVNNVKGALDAGGGIYEVLNLNNAANYSKIYWDDTNNKATTVTTMPLLGYVVSRGGGGANTACDVMHWPYQ